MNTLDKRINILFEAKQIDEQTKKKLIEIINFFKVKYSIVLTEDNGSMLITHIAMAHMRSKKKEPVTKLDEVIVNQLKVSKQYDDAIVCVEEINEILNGVLPEEEVEYVLMHVLNLLEKE